MAEIGVFHPTYRGYILNLQLDPWPTLKWKEMVISNYFPKF